MTSTEPQPASTPRPADLAKQRFEALYRETRDDLYGYLRYMLGDSHTAEDVLAQTVERAYRKRGRFNAQRGSARAWLFGIARNAALDELRRRKRSAVLGFVPEDTEADHTDQSHARMQVMDALTQLEPRQRELVALKFFGGLENRAIATVLGISASNAGTQLHRAITTMREAMTDEI
ncbi:MAG: sigma-70 family RNA polymerase sigma factor [Thermoleophilaceae bacterium]|nr:sigma-70 family RNA polymerase sigma factor [Thermoleophilaceae bacterium]